MPMFPGTTLVMTANQKHWFRATGDKPLITYGVHVLRIASSMFMKVQCEISGDSPEALVI